MRRLALFAAIALIAAACGDAGPNAGTFATTAPPPSATTPAPTATTPATEAPATEAPATEAPATEAPAVGITPGEDPDVDAVVTAFTTAFDSISSFEEKAAYIDDPSGLEGTVAGYVETGESFGGIGVLVTSVVINGDEADVFYDLLFGGNPTYPNLEGNVVRGDAGWQVPRAVFCGLMTSARVPCS